MSSATDKVSKKKYVHKPKPKTTVNIRKATGTFKSTGDARVDLFFRTARGVDEGELKEMLSASWKVSPLDTLKIIFQARDCRGGKGERLIFQQSLTWLQENFPETAVKNFEQIPNFGSWKDIVKLIGTNLEPQALQLYANQLQKDLTELTSKGEKANISLAAKWAPTEGKHDDTQTKATSKIAMLLSESKHNYKPVYRKKFITPLRKHLKITETLMAANKWSDINYAAVPSRCMALSKKAFERHEPALFSEYLEKLKKGETKVNAKQLFPHEIVAKYINGEQEDTILEEQWKVILEETRKLGTLEDCLVISDVSGSMSGTPMQVSIALGILIATLTKAPFQKIVLTFSENPQFHFLQGDTLREQVNNLSRADWGQSTNFNQVFTMILGKAVENKLPQSAMPKKLFVISDMEFDSAQSGETNSRDIELQYEKAGYEMPTIIYWNVNGASNSIPVNNSTLSKVALISGFSPSILKSVLSKGDASEITPLSILKNAIEDERYSSLHI